ncbi:Tetratricopeptide repeat protein 19-like protein, mitochondrial [Frankliniella fusca]|uniref:Tetratricopeptide repeat protein 19-like protein, mitochondrial n=1 Tax=Frankliniella fusca TaxID=407009 RepID=A0AAE1GSK9_9NEOP|nr:Tetratricopeptide repeat protein 19-like protein, mitochondrial [Frankliniella fusca]
MALLRHYQGKGLALLRLYSQEVTHLERNSSDLAKCWRWKGSRHDYGKQKKFGSPYSLMFVPAILKGLFSSEEAEEANPETNLVSLIKRSILQMQARTITCSKGETEKAERLLHIALKMAQDLKHEKGITYVYDTMANLAFENGEYAKAQGLFVEVLRRLIGSGLPQDDMIVINISLKIADTFVALSEYEKGEQGFLFCIDTLKKKISAGASDEDTLMLLAQALDRYSLYLHHERRPKEAIQHIEKAIEIAESTLGTLDNKVGAILLSDMGVIKTAAGEKEVANQCFEKALDIAKKEEVDTSAAVIMVNRGVALGDYGSHEDAIHWCELGLQRALKENNTLILKAAEECLKANKNVKTSNYEKV